ncbi:MAG: hypothetical protein EOO39_43165, partial [Cytophagaceae bacterium]
MASNATNLPTSVSYTATATDPATTCTASLAAPIVTVNPIPTTPTSLATSVTLNPTSSSTLVGSFVPASFNVPTGYVVVRSTSATLPVLTNTTTYTVGANGAIATNGYVEYVGNGSGPSWTSTGLLPSTQYFYFVFSLNNSVCPGGPMYSTSATQGDATTQPCIAYSGILSVGPSAGATFPNLTTAISSLISCTYSGNVVLELQAAYTGIGEIYPITFPATLLASAGHTITVRPESGATNLTITSANSTGTININGAGYIAIDGRVGSTGTTKQLTIENTNAGASYALQFINDASNNSVRFVTLKSVNNVATSGTVVFGGSTGTTGNDNNLIDFCDVLDGATLPVNGIYSAGTSAAIDNSSNSVTNSNIANYFSNGSG